MVMLSITVLLNTEILNKQLYVQCIFIYIILKGVRAVAQAGNKHEELSPLALFAFFVNCCKENLHIVVAFSPIGDAFRNRLRQFPSLINCCTIDWFQVCESICFFPQQTVCFLTISLFAYVCMCISFCIQCIILCFFKILKYHGHFWPFFKALSCKLSAFLQ